jgi:hypothetical protein
MIITIIGWTAIILSWFIPELIEDQQKARYVKGLLNAFALGWFLASILIKYLAL